jgi:hypothetical protein
LTRPTLTPDQVKELLTGTAKPLVGVDAIGQGAGRLDLNAAAMAATPTTATQSFVKALGTGTLEGARGTAHVTDPETLLDLTGEKDIMGKAWSPATWTVASAADKALGRRHLERQRLGRHGFWRLLVGVADLVAVPVDSPHLVRRVLVGADLELRRLDRRNLDRPDLVGTDLVGPHLERRLLGVPQLAVTRRDSRGAAKAPRLSALMELAATPCSRDDDGAGSVPVRRCRLAVAS